MKSLSLLLKIAFLLAVLTLVSCQSMNLTPQAAQGNDLQDIRVNTAEPSRTTAKVEQFPLPNCGGTDKLAQTLGTYASASKSASVGAKAKIKGGGG